VLTYDSRRDQVVVRSGGVEKLLTLRRSTGAANGPAYSPPPALVAAPAGFTPPSANPIGNAGGAPVAGANPAIATPADPAKPAAPLTIARQEEEARMLVSDLLEIGMAQRKAYEEAQKKATEAAASAQPVAAPNSPPTPAPVAPPANASGG
jgi:hypothetical protein